ncbi:RagB/SusD family nutrient uptake outer membrane protein [Capnocytophaga leadbetteri]
MKKIYKIITLVVAPLFFAGCFSLDQQPYEDLSQANSFKTVQDAQFWVNGMYNTLRTNVYGSAMYATDLQADFLNMTKRDGTNETITNFQNWSLFTVNNGATAAIWQRYWKAVQDINIGLEGIPTIAIPQENYRTDSAQIKHNIGELYLARAYYYTYLITHYCPTDEASAYGLPLLSGPTINNFPNRSTVGQTYDFILADIAQAETRLSDVTGSLGAEKFTKDAVAALKARVLLYRGKWAEAYAAATSIIGSRYSLVTSSSDLEKVWKDDDTAESIVQLYAKYDVGNTAELPSANDIYLGYQREWNNRLRRFEIRYLPRAVPTQDFVDLYNNSDYRKSIYIKKLFANYGSVTFTDLYLVNKYPDNPLLKQTSGTSSTYMHRPKVFRIAEIYLIAAEAAYKNNDQTNAKTYLDRLRAARGIGRVTYTDLWAEIQNERNRELAFEGFRMADIKRWNLGVVRGTPQNLNAIVSDPADQYHQLNIPAANYKMVWPLPPSDILYERGRANWQQNPGW